MTKKQEKNERNKQGKKKKQEKNERNQQRKKKRVTGNTFNVLYFTLVS